MRFQPFYEQRLGTGNGQVALFQVVFKIVNFEFFKLAGLQVLQRGKFGHVG